MKIFISYASEDRRKAAELTAKLPAHHNVFFDRQSLPPGEGYDALIDKEINSCDLFVFLISADSIAEGKFTLSELQVAKDRWRNPSGHVLPVKLDEIDDEVIDPYLTAVGYIAPGANVVFDTLRAVSDLEDGAAPGVETDAPWDVRPEPWGDSGNEDDPAVFRLRFGPSNDGHYRFSFGSADDRGVEPRAVIRFNPASMQERLMASSTPLAGVFRREPNSEEATSLPSAETARQIGTELYEALASASSTKRRVSWLPWPTESSSVWDAYELLERSAGSSGGSALRFVINAHSAPEVAQLPWEFLYDPVERNFVARNPWTPVIRTLNVDRPNVLEPISGPLKILLASAQLPGRPELAISQELAKLDASLRKEVDRGELEVQRLDRIDVEELNDKLDEFRPHILHFIGHGGIRQDDGFILIDGLDGRPTQELSGDQLGGLLSSFLETQPRLVFLNSCLGAAQTNTNAFGGMAQRLLQHGVPAVIAMQFPIPDTAAVSLSKKFYQGLTKGQSVETALSGGRNLLYSRDDTTVDWAAPALYKRSPERAVFNVDRADVRPSPGAAAKPPTGSIASSVGRGRLGRLWLAAGSVLAVALVFGLLTLLLRGESGERDEVSTMPTATSPAATSSSSPPTTSPSIDGASAEETELRLAVEAALTAGGNKTVIVAVTGNDVILSGTVASLDEQTEVEAAAAAVDGVAAVRNRLIIEDGDESNGTDSLNDELGLGPITFDYRSSVADPGGQAVLADVIAYLGANDVAVEIQGHTDSDGTEADNVALGLARACVVKDHFQGAGIDGARLHAVGIGETQPLTPNDSDEGRAANRRIELIRHEAVEAGDECRRYLVRSGDSLSSIARLRFGDPARWPGIWDANRASIADPDLLRVGQLLVLPNVD